MKQPRWELQRIFWYIAGLFLFFAPFALYQRSLMLFFGQPGSATIHTMCLRRPLLYFLPGVGEYYSVFAISLLSLVLVVVIAFFFGPFFCGKLCTTGALPEYISRLMPKKWQIDWGRIVNPVPVRYGFLAGFILSPFFAGSIAHTYCNFRMLEMLLGLGIDRNIGVLTSTMIITLFLWLVLFGIMGQGGRGFCNFLCPVGAVQSLVHAWGSRWHFTYKIGFQQFKCINCKVCESVCPMGCWQTDTEETIVKHNIHHCITCRQCEKYCPTKSIVFGRGMRHEFGQRSCVL